MDKSFLITTGNQHQYVYSDALCYFLYVPEEMATVMEHMDYGGKNEACQYVVGLKMSDCFGFQSVMVE